MKVILAGPDKETLTHQAYPAFAAAGLDVAAVVTAPEELAPMALALDDGVAVVQADLYPSPDEAVQALTALAPMQVAVIIPAWWEGEQERFTRLGNLVTGFTAPVGWPQIAAEIKARAQRSREAEEHGQPAVTLRSCSSAPPNSRLAQLHVGGPAPHGNPRRTVAFWSGPAGGTGQTTLALALAEMAAGRGVDVVLLAFSEPAVSVYLGLPRVPNAMAFFKGETVQAIEQKVTWQADVGTCTTSHTALNVLLGPARPEEGADVDLDQVGALVAAARAAHAVVLLDLPPLTPGSNGWALAPLGQASDIVLVAPPTPVGVVAVVEALVTLRGIGASGRVHLALNHRSPGEPPVSPRQFVTSVANLWGSSPDSLIQVEFSRTFPHLVEQRVPLNAADLLPTLDVLAQVAIGLPGPQPTASDEQQGDRSLNFRRLLPQIEIAP